MVLRQSLGWFDKLATAVKGTETSTTEGAEGTKKGRAAQAGAAQAGPAPSDRAS